MQALLASCQQAVQLTMEIALNSMTVIITWFFVVGVVVGSFINVVAHRLPEMLERDWKAQSREMLGLAAVETGPRYSLFLHCPHCGHVIRLRESIPLISYALLRGKCSACQLRISPRYPLVEVACGLLSAWVVWKFGFGLQAAAALAFTWALLTVSLIDIDHQLLPDVIIQPLLWLGLIVNTFGVFVPLADALLGAVVGYLVLWLVYWVCKHFTGRDGMGYGDFKLLATVGAWGGWQILPLTILLSSVVAAVLGLIILRLRNVDSGTPLPFGPYLALSGWIALSWRHEVVVFTAAVVS